MNIAQLESWFDPISLGVVDPMMLARIGVAILLVSLWWMLLARASARQRRERLELIEQVENLRRENRSVVELAVRAGKRLREVETQLNQFDTRLEAMSHPAPAADGGQAYDQAIRMVRRGADAERLVSDFGLARGEADLMVRLHGPRKAG